VDGGKRKEKWSWCDKMANINLSEFAIGIVILGIVAAIGTTVLIDMRDTQLTDTDTSSLTSQTFDEPTAAWTYLDTTDWVKSLDGVWNDTTGDTIGAGNYTFTINDYGQGYINASTIGATELGEQSGTWSVNYSVYNKSDPRFSIADDAATGLLEYGNWFKIFGSGCNFNTDFCCFQRR